MERKEKERGRGGGRETSQGVVRTHKALEDVRMTKGFEENKKNNNNRVWCIFLHI